MKRTIKAVALGLSLLLANGSVVYAQDLNAEGVLHLLTRLVLENIFYTVPMALFAFMALKPNIGYKLSGIILCLLYPALTLIGPIIENDQRAVVTIVFELLGALIGVVLFNIVGKKTIAVDTQEGG